MGISDHLSCLLRNPYEGQEATVTPGHGTTDWFQIGTEVHHGCILLCRRRNETPTLQSGLNLYILTLVFYSCFILYLLHNNLQGKLPNTITQRLYSAQAQGEITFTLTYLLQLRLFWELPYQLRIRFVPGSVPFEESEKHPCVQEMFFSHGNKQRILS